MRQRDDVVVPWMGRVEVGVEVEVEEELGFMNGEGLRI